MSLKHAAQALAALGTVLNACNGGPPAGTFAGNGVCTFGDGGIAAQTVGPDTDAGETGLLCADAGACDLPDGGLIPICGGDLNSRMAARVVDMSQTCACSEGFEAQGKPVIDPLQQKQNLLSLSGNGLDKTQLFAGCKDAKDRCKDAASCYFWQADPIGCFQLGFLNGFIQNLPAQYPGGPFDDLVGHDGDEAPNMCVTTMGVQGPLNGQDTLDEMDLRAANTFNDKDGEMEFEIPWCRWFGGQITIPADDSHPEVTFCDMRPEVAGQRISLVGDWVVDGTHTEVHEARIIATVKPDQVLDGGCPTRIFSIFDESLKGTPDAAGYVNAGLTNTTTNCDDPSTPGCPNPNVWHMLTNGVFSKDTAQQDRLFVRVPLPPATFDGGKQLPCAIPQGQVGGCSQGVTLGDRSKAANEDRLKTGQRA